MMFIHYIKNIDSEGQNPSELKAEEARSYKVAFKKNSIYLGIFFYPYKFRNSGSFAYYVLDSG